MSRRGAELEEEAERLRSTSRELRVPSRADNLKRLAGGEEFDLLVIGGGATGCGVALDAQLRGLSVALVEQEDFASGTSSKSTKLLWAGSRYLVKALVKLFSPSSLLQPSAAYDEFLGTWNMVMGCFRERTYMLNMNPHLANWIPIAVPLDRWIIWPPPFDYYPAALGTVTGMFVGFFKFYDALSLWMAPKSYVMSPSVARREFPQLDGKRMKYVSVFYEGAHNDSRTNLSIALTAAMHGACMTNYTEATEILFDGEVACGARIKDTSVQDATPFEVRAKKVVYAGGPFTDELRKLSEGQDVAPVVNGSGGTHIVLPAHYCPRNMGMVDMMTSRGSFLFFLPWEGHTVVGTTDVKSKPHLHHRVPEDEIQYLINECERYLSPNLKVRRRDVMSAWYGVRPLCGDPHGSNAASRDHVVSHHPTNGVTFVSGGKWTTWREMAEDCVDQVIELNADFKKKAGPSMSLKTPLLGAGPTHECPNGFHENLAVELSQSYDLPYDVAQHLARNYGTRAPDVLIYAANVKGTAAGLFKNYPRLYEGSQTTFPYLEAEVRYAVMHEYAVTPADILGRRTRLAYLNSTAARLALPRVVEIMAECLGWDATQQEFEHARAEDHLATDYAGPVPNKSSAKLRMACTADVKDIFDRIDTSKKGTLSAEGIRVASHELGFPLNDMELQVALRDMDTNRSGEVSFPEFLMWWNSCEESKALQGKIFRGVRGGEKWATVED